MAKLNREARMRERRLDKQARKDARKAQQADEASGTVTTQVEDTEYAGPVAASPYDV